LQAGQVKGREQLRRAFADTVRIVRKRQGISQEKLAFEAGLDRGYMGALEREKHTPTIESIYKLLPVLGIGFIEFAAEFERVLHSRCHPVRKQKAQ
jgi:transcriptional regulator with XRE-family HTH domain